MKSINRIRGKSRTGQWRAATQAAGLNVPAMSQAIPFLKSLPGPRGLWGNLNMNLINNGLFTMSMQNFTSSCGQWDDENFYNFCRLAQSSTQYMVQSSGSTFWSVDSGVSAWNNQTGLTVGAWVRPTAYGQTNNHGLLSAWDANNNLRSWRLSLQDTGSDNAEISISSGGTATTNNVSLSSSEVLPAGTWGLIIGRWNPSTILKIDGFWNGNQYTGTTAVSIASSLYAPATLKGYLGAYKNSTGTIHSLHGDLGISFFLVSYLPDDTIQTIYQVTRKIYKV